MNTIINGKELIESFPSFQVRILCIASTEKRNPIYHGMICRFLFLMNENPFRVWKATAKVFLRINKFPNRSFWLFVWLLLWAFVCRFARELFAANSWRAQLRLFRRNEQILPWDQGCITTECFPGQFFYPLTYAASLRLTEEITPRQSTRPSVLMRWIYL